jgi:hypothetical protein
MSSAGQQQPHRPFALKKQTPLPPINPKADLSARQVILFFPGNYFALPPSTSVTRPTDAGIPKSLCHGGTLAAQSATRHMGQVCR